MPQVHLPRVCSAGQPLEKQAVRAEKVTLNNSHSSKPAVARKPQTLTV
ncbi:hypothetical protein [Methylomonas fluvii]|nr:hypothetical protein [Methylomonas fluvii]